MSHISEIKGGERLTPLDIPDVMEAIKDYMGTDIRQYLEEYLPETEGGAGEIAKEKICDHYKQVLINTKDKTEAAVRLMERPHMNREAIQATLDVVSRMAEREYRG